LTQNNCMSFFGRISTKEHYGVRLALRIAGTYYDQKPISLAEIAKIEKISMKYLEQLVVPLRKAKWVESQRGRSGGYVMKKDPNKLTFKDLILLLDEDLSIVECLKNKPAYKCEFLDSCESRKAYKQIQNALESTMKDIKLSTLIKL